MLFSETQFEGAEPILAYGDSFFRVGEKKIHGGIFMFNQILLPWGGFDDLLFLEENVSDMEILFIGTGTRYELIPEAFRSTLKKSGIVPEILSTPVACRAYNVTISGHRKAGALLFPILKN